MEDMESLLIPQISMDVDDTPLNLEESHSNADESAATTDSDNEENIQMRLRNLLELENFDPAQTPDKLTPAEIEAKERLFSEGHPPIEYVRMHCSSCNCHLGTAPLNQDNRYIHPMLNVLVCKNCYEFYCSGDFEKDEDGSELYCRWCGQGGKVMCCSGCAYVFCQRCVRQNLGKRTLDLIIESDDWYCFACNPSQLINLRILCVTLFDYVKQEIREVKQSGEIDRLRRDFSMCCSNKSVQQKYLMPVRKRRRAPSEDQTYHPSRDKDLLDNRRIGGSSALKKALLNNHGTGTVGGMNKPLPPLHKGPSAAGPATAMVVQSPPPLVGISGGNNSANIRFSHQPGGILQRGPTISTIRGFPPPQIHPRPTPLLQNVLNSTTPARPLLTAKPVQLLCATNTRPITSNTVTNMAAALNNQLTSNRGSQNFIPLNSNQLLLQQPQHTVTRVTNNNSQRRVSSLPTHFPPGIRNNWFNQAATITSTIVARLSTTLVDLSNEQANATSVEQLATVHNKLQELLSSSVNSMIQVRKNLRNEFLNDLNKMKFTAVPKLQPNNNNNAARKVSKQPLRMLSTQPIAVDDDDDVILVNNEEEDPLAITTTAQPEVDTTAVVETMTTTALAANKKTECQLLAGPGIKIKVKTDLFKPPEDVHEETTTTNTTTTLSPPNGSDPIKVVVEEEDASLVEDSKADIVLLLVNDDKAPPPLTSPSKKENVITTATTTKAVVEEKTEPDEQEPSHSKETKPLDDLANVDKETYLQIQHALAESKLEALIEENSKYKVDTAEICPEELAKILTVRVVLTTKFSPINPTTPKQRRLLSSSSSSALLKQEFVVLSPSKNPIDFEEILHGNLINTEQAKPHFDQAFSTFVQQEQNKSTLDDAVEVENDDDEIDEDKEVTQEKHRDIVVDNAMVQDDEPLGKEMKSVEEEEKDKGKDKKTAEEILGENSATFVGASGDEKMHEISEQIDVR